MTYTTTILPHVRLQFAIDNPSLEECYAYGYQAATAELSEDENPYGEGSLEFEQWQEGWWASLYGENPMYEVPPLAESESELISLDTSAANDRWFIPRSGSLISRFARVTSAIAATAIVGYQVIDLVA